MTSEDGNINDFIRETSLKASPSGLPDLRQEGTGLPFFLITLRATPWELTRSVLHPKTKHPIFSTSPFDLSLLLQSNESGAQGGSHLFDFLVAPPFESVLEILLSSIPRSPT